MTKSEVFLIISQIYCVGGLIVGGERGFLYTVGLIWLIMSIVVGILK
jgi:hypothetical protein